MSEENTTKLSFRLNTKVYAALSACAKDAGRETMAYIQKVLTDHAIQSDKLASEEADKLLKTEKVISMAVAKAQALNKPELFTEDFVLTVFEHLMKDPVFVETYEDVIDGNAYAVGLPGKSPLNMYLGWYIKNAIGADPKMGPDGKPERVQVRNQPIQSYTRLVAGSGVQTGF